MPHIPESKGPNEWHRYFAMEANNRAWDLSVAQRSPAEDAEMLNAAHAAAFHWQIVGTELNHMRATMLLAEVHALLRMGPSAAAYAETMRDYFIEADPPDWEWAFVHTIHAHAALTVGNDEAHASSYADAKCAIAAIESDQERAIVLKTFEQLPVPE